MKKLQGITLIGMLLTMVVVVCVGLVALRVVPVYIQHYSIVESIVALNRIPLTEFSDDPASNANILKTKLLNQLYVNSIESIPPEAIQIIPKGPNQFEISTKYKVISPLVGNVSLLFRFSTKKEVKLGSAS